jgi:hypothetical protein
LEICHALKALDNDIDNDSKSLTASVAASRVLDEMRRFKRSASRAKASRIGVDPPCR